MQFSQLFSDNSMFKKSRGDFNFAIAANKSVRGLFVGHDGSNGRVPGLIAPFSDREGFPASAATGGNAEANVYGAKGLMVQEPGSEV